MKVTMSPSFIVALFFATAGLLHFLQCFLNRLWRWERRGKLWQNKILVTRQGVVDRAFKKTVNQLHNTAAFARVTEHETFLQPRSRQDCHIHCELSSVRLWVTLHVLLFLSCCVICLFVRQYRVFKALVMICLFVRQYRVFEALVMLCTYRLIFT